MTSEKTPSMNHFERVPPDLVNKILTRLDSEHISAAIEVCKAWRTLLTPSVVRSLYSPHPLVFSNAFFVEFECYESREGMLNHDGKGALYVRVVVDMQGRLYRHDTANTPQFHFEKDPIKATTHNGLVAYVKHLEGLYVMNPAVKRGKKIEMPPSYFPPLRPLKFVPAYLRANFQFSGLHFDARTSDFIYVVGCSGAFSNYNTGRSLWIYHSISDNWTNLSEVANFEERNIPCCLAVYSWGCFFWYANDTSIDNSNEQRVVGFNIEGQHFFDIEFPQLDDKEEQTSRIRKWALKGCEDWVVLLLNVDGVFKKCWRLVSDEDGYVWVQLTTDLGMLEYLFTVFRNVDSRGGLYNINGQGWWCVADCAPEESGSDDDDGGDYGHFTIYDEYGKFKHCVEKRQLISELGINGRNVRVRGVWPFQINNICWPRW